jgi:hypothetical protein
MSWQCHHLRAFVRPHGNSVSRCLLDRQSTRRHPEICSRQHAGVTYFCVATQHLPTGTPKTHVKAKIRVQPSLAEIVRAAAEAFSYTPCRPINGRRSQDLQLLILTGGIAEREDLDPYGWSSSIDHCRRLSVRRSAPVRSARHRRRAHGSWVLNRA